MVNSLKYANENIKLLIKHRGWTQPVLCKKTGITEVTLKRKLNAKTPGWTMLEAVSIANAFDLPVSDIFFTRMIPKCNTQ